jgi:hypothetical protein
VRRALLVAFVAALACASSAAAALPVFQSGSAVGEGLPLKAYATVTPTVHLFADAVTAKLAVVADTKLVDPSRLRVTADFTPYTALHAPTLLKVHVGRFEQMTWTWTLRCLTARCVPVKPPSEIFHVFRFHPVQIDYLGTNGKLAYGITASWPAVEVVSQVSPGVIAFLRKTNRINWRYRLTPVAAPAYRVSPMLLFWLALAVGGAALLTALVLARRWYLLVRPRAARSIALPPGSTLERALAVLAWAHERGDETLQRKAFERVADELARADELRRAARELAWSQRTPEDEEVSGFADQVRGVSDEEPEPV